MLICDLYNKNKLRLSESNSVLAFEIITYRNVFRYIYEQSTCHGIGKGSVISCLFLKFSIMCYKIST